MSVAIHRRRRVVQWRNAVPFVTVSGEPRRVSRLLTPGDANAKLVKNEGRGFRTAALSLAPAQESGIGDVCGGRSPGCTAACLHSTGRANIWEMIKAARIAKTVLFFRERQYFLDRLAAELQAERAKANEREERLAFRPNVFSDLPWERIAPEILAIPDENYDYTKLPHRAGAVLPNYWVTFSRSETNDATSLALLRQGANVAVAFYGGLPGQWQGFPVVSGDETDLRFLDPRGGHVVGLRLKAFDHIQRAAAIASGFALPGVL